MNKIAAIIVSAYAIVWVPIFLYRYLGIWVDFFHDTLGLHVPDNSYPVFYDNKIHTKCKYCGKDIYLDDNNNWM